MRILRIDFSATISEPFRSTTGKLVGVVALKELRKAIEDVNSGNLTVNSVNSDAEQEKQPLSAQEEPLLNGKQLKQDTVSSLDSAVSNSDVELGNVVSKK